MTSKETFVCTADLFDGLSINIVSYCGLSPLSDEQEDTLWNEITEVQLVEECHTCDLIITGECDDGPGLSTISYDLITNNEDAFKAELRLEISYRIGVDTIKTKSD